MTAASLPQFKAVHNEWNIECKVWVGGLGEEGTRLELEVAFEEIGPVKNIWLAKNPPSFAFIEMEDPRDAEDAVKALDGTELCGMIAHVEMAKAKEERRREAQQRLLREEMLKRKRRMEEERKRERRKSRTRSPRAREEGRSKSRGNASEKGHSSRSSYSRSKSKDYRRDRRDYKSEPKEYRYERRTPEKQQHRRNDNSEHSSTSKGKGYREESRSYRGSKQLVQKDKSRKRDKPTIHKADKSRRKHKPSDSDYVKSPRSSPKNSATIERSIKVEKEEERRSDLEEGELGSTDEDEDPYADQTKFR